MDFLDVVLVPVRAAAREAYLAHARITKDVFFEHGALEVWEAWGEDLPPGEVTSYALALKLEPGETAVVAVVRWPSREVRDEGMAKVMQDPRIPDPEPDMIDGRRMVFGGFAPLPLG